MQSKAATVAAYLKELPPEKKAVLATLRKLIREAAPKAKESMEYGMPCYEGVCALAAQKQYFALYIGDSKVVNRYRAKLGKLSIGKGCIRFRKLEDLPLDVVREMLAEVVDRLEKGITSGMCE